ncbi:P-loop containing nucleoside triphosphate hydrolase protein [Zopfia rhizophila CBS 207.26]|uniref:RNA helicase n=1 Tax=Zopfia rhizophila CBS 207.26 TaxID=1314779 RepID=A0A6A6ECK7_9PEZI|nr:P-loop containing nucleoside triphosphate hydrolase protein [Zopfia rhizophila CBS 207.26]
MHAQTTRRSSLCLLCTFAPRPKPWPFLPHIQVAQRVTTAPRKVLRPGSGKIGSYNPLTQKIKSFGGPLKTPEAFQELVQARLDILRPKFQKPAFLESLKLTETSFEQAWSQFVKSILQWIKRDSSSELATIKKDAKNGKSTLDMRLRYLFYARMLSGRFTQAELENQRELADLRYPGEWYPATREITRTVHLHVGPTNSGKTYHALKRLEEAETGIYLGPLRLLAHEVYTRLNAKGKPCALVTGEEQRLPEGGHNMWSCTVEMAPLNNKLEVAVIDEIQMINHDDRGWAWTQAFLGIQAREVHLCGEERAVPIIRELCALIGDKVEVHKYERLSPLKVADRSLDGRLDKLEKGDCVVAFSVLGIHALRREIERKTGRKVAIVYGSLPPETRAQQAKLFNDPNNDYDFLVASDAIGMGLNLSIKRVIFEATTKSNGQMHVPLRISEVKQIAGRAGRYRTSEQAISQDTASKDSAPTAVDPTIGLDDLKPETAVQPYKPEIQTVGYATTLERFDFRHLKRCMESEPEPIRSAGLFPPSLIIERFANYFPPGTPFSYIMLRLHEISDIHPRFHLCGLKDQLAIADVIHPITNLTVQERITICAAPLNCRDAADKQFLHGLAECIAKNKSGALLEVPHLPLEILDKEPSKDRQYLKELEQLHKMLVLYLWLSFRFPNVFTTRSLANHTKKLVEDAIENTLSTFSFTEQSKQALRKKRQEALRREEEFEKQMAEEVLDQARVGGEKESFKAEDRAAASMDEASVDDTEAQPQEVKGVLNNTRPFASEATAP